MELDKTTFQPVGQLDEKDHVKVRLVGSQHDLAQRRDAALPRRAYSCRNWDKIALGRWDAPRTQ